MRICLLSLAMILTAGGAIAQQAPENLAEKLVVAAIERTIHEVTYDGSYRRIGYPNGDVPDSIGVCTDVVVRSFRKIGVDLQRLVHEDMTTHFAEYPKIWGLSGPDPNIDHRRVPNLQRFFERQSAALPKSEAAEDYRPGDLVTWMLPGELPHIGIVIDRYAQDGGRRLVVHNIGAGPQIEDVLFQFEIRGIIATAVPDRLKR